MHPIKGFLYSCIQQEQCDREVFYDGLPTQLNALLSCHQCLDPTQVPTLAVKTGANWNDIQGILSFGISTGATYHDDTGGINVQCKTADNTSFGIADPLLFVLPDNCGLFLLDTQGIKTAVFSSQASFDTSVAGASIVCGACKPAYKAVHAQYNVLATA